MNAKISIFVICAQAIIYLLLHHLHDCTFEIRYIAGHLKKEHLTASPITQL